MKIISLLLQKPVTIAATGTGEWWDLEWTTGLNKQRSREVFAAMLAGCPTAKQAMDQLGIKVIADRDELADIVRRAIAANPKAVADFKKGKTKAADAIKGAVMRETKGMAQTDLVQQIVMEELQKA